MLKHSLPLTPRTLTSYFVKKKSCSNYYITLQLFLWFNKNCVIFEIKPPYKITFMLILGGYLMLTSRLTINVFLIKCLRWRCIMIIMINGAVGSGKTSVAYMLQPMLEKSIIFDPEEIGCMLKRIIPDHVRLKEEQTGDYQDMELWGILTVKTAREMIERYNTDLI